MARDLNRHLGRERRQHGCRLAAMSAAVNDVARRGHPRARAAAWMELRRMDFDEPECSIGEAARRAVIEEEVVD